MTHDRLASIIYRLISIHRECAQKIVDGLVPKLGDIMEEPEIAGPGFINIRFKEDYLSSAVGLMAKDATGRLGVPRTR
jgi:arginyl-tRNA synthetase